MKKFKFKKKTDEPEILDAELDTEEEELKKCRICGRTILDPNNKSGLCPKHANAGKTIGASVLVAGLGVAIKNGAKIAKVVSKLIIK